MLTNCALPISNTVEIYLIWNGEIFIHTFIKRLSISTSPPMCCVFHNE